MVVSLNYATTIRTPRVRTLLRRVRARGKHSKTYEWSDWAEEYFAASKDGHWAASAEFVQVNVGRDRLLGVSELHWASPEDQRMFSDVAEQLAVDDFATELFTRVFRVRAGPFAGYGIQRAVSAVDGGSVRLALSDEDARILLGPYVRDLARDGGAIRP